MNSLNAHSSSKMVEPSEVFYQEISDATISKVIEFTISLFETTKISPYFVDSLDSQYWKGNLEKCGGVFPGYAAKYHSAKEKLADRTFYELKNQIAETEKQLERTEQEFLSRSLAVELRTDSIEVGQGPGLPNIKRGRTVEEQEAPAQAQGMEIFKRREALEEKLSRLKNQLPHVKQMQILMNEPVQNFINCLFEGLRNDDEVDEFIRKVSPLIKVANQLGDGRHVSWVQTDRR